MLFSLSFLPKKNLTPSGEDSQLFLEDLDEGVYGGLRFQEGVLGIGNAAVPIVVKDHHPSRLQQWPGKHGIGEDVTGDV